jgi:hypothetical protein
VQGGLYEAGIRADGESILREREEFEQLKEMKKKTRS